MPEIVQEIGAYAGLASVVGLAVLSALYFSQARDVKRLREWAGRAPERSEQGAPAVPGRVVAQPQQPATAARPVPVPTPAAKATPGAKPTPAAVPGRPAAATPAAAAAAATGAGPATAQQDKPTGAPVPAGQNANAGAAAASGAAASSPPASPPAGSPPAGSPPASSPAAKPDGEPGDGKPASEAADKPAAGAGTATPSPGSGPPASAPAAPSSGPPAGAPPAVPPAAPPRQAPAATPAGSRGAGPGTQPEGEGRFARRPGVTSRHSPQETAILPPRGKSNGGLSARYLAVALVGLLVLGSAAAYGVIQLVKDDDTPAAETSSGGGSNDTDGSANEKPDKQGGAVKPASVTVAVLNGTTVPGLAATLSDEVGAAGFKVGTITNFSDQQLAESVVQYAPGHEAEARAVSRKLGIGQREPVNPSSQALAGDATVIVIAGADKAP